MTRSPYLRFILCLLFAAGLFSLVGCEEKSESSTAEQVLRGARAEAGSEAGD